MSDFELIFWISAGIIIAIMVFNIVKDFKYSRLENKVFKELNLSRWNIPKYDDFIEVKSWQALENYDDIRYIKESDYDLDEIEEIIEAHTDFRAKIISFYNSNPYKNRWQYHKINTKLINLLNNTPTFKVLVSYVTRAGNNLGSKEIEITDVELYREHPEWFMTKSEYNKYQKEQQKELLKQRQSDFYELINSVIDIANQNKDLLIIKGSKDKLDDLISNLFDRTVNSVKKIKELDSEEWDLIAKFIDTINSEVKKIVESNKRIIDYYDSNDFLKIKETCASLMQSQKEFNDYVKEKVETVATMFGTKAIRNSTVNQDEYNYIRPYKKTVTPFTAELSASSFASAENNTLDYVIKNFYPNKKEYPEQIKKLYTLIDELETLKDAKQIIENYKKEYKEYLKDVPNYVLRDDSDGFYSRLGFANIDESIFNVEYKFSYTSNGGFAHRSFTFAMTEQNIVELIKALENKLTTKAFVHQQRLLMTKKLREFIKNRDNFTCCICGNSTHVEPNLLLEIDHIRPVSKGGETIKENLQTLCWKCNRAKRDKILS